MKRPADDFKHQFFKHKKNVKVIKRKELA